MIGPVVETLKQKNEYFMDKIRLSFKYYELPDDAADSEADSAVSSRSAASSLAVSHRIAYPLVPHKVSHCCYAVSVFKGHYAEQRKLFCNKGKKSTKYSH